MAVDNQYSAGLLDKPTVNNSSPQQQTKPDALVADERSVDTPTMTVAGQMDTILSKGNPYIDRARTKAAQTANSRGLLNSSMAAGAGEAAAIDAALPIAQQDAQTHFNQQGINQDASNTARSFNADFQNQDYFRDKDLNSKLAVDDNTTTNQMAVNSQQNQAAMDLQGQQDAATMERLKFDNETKVFLANQDKLMQEKIAAGEMTQKDRQYYSEYVNETSQQYQVQTTKIATDPGMSAAEKNRALEDLFNSYKNNMSVMSDLYSVDISWTEGDQAGPVSQIAGNDAAIAEAEARAAAEAEAEARAVNRFGLMSDNDDNGF